MAPPSSSRGTNFTGASAVTFGPGHPAASFTVVSPTQITAVSPPEVSGTVDVTVTTPGNTSPIVQPADQYTFGAPSVTAVSPVAGTVNGANTVTITGRGFTVDSTVLFGPSPATAVTVVSATLAHRHSAGARRGIG